MPFTADTVAPRYQMGNKHSFCQVSNFVTTSHMLVYKKGNIIEKRLKYSTGQQRLWIRINYNPYATQQGTQRSIKLQSKCEYNLRAKNRGDHCASLVG